METGIDKPSWTLDEALKIVRDLESKLVSLGFHAALGGSVLHHGHSYKDLDIIIIPHWSTEFRDWTPVKDYLREVFGAAKIVDCKHNPPVHIRDAKSVSWLRIPDGRRIDFFFLK